MKIVLGLLIFLTILCAILSLCTGCRTFSITGNEQTEVIAKQEAKIEQLKENNERMWELINGISNDVSDLREWAKQWKPIVEEWRLIYEKNKSIIDN